MRKLYFLLPGKGGTFACGGLWAELKTFNLAQEVCSANIVTYRQREKDTLFLDDLLKDKNSIHDLEDIIFVVSWGFDIPKLVTKLRSYHVVYHAHSAGYGFRLPPRIPIITVSRNTMGYWGQKSPNSLIYYLPNQIADEFHNLNRERDIDVLVQARKSSEYLMSELIPGLKQQCNLVVIDSYIEDLPGLFNRAKVYLYDSAEYWAQQRVSEGFGLQPMEALACGCQVFSSVNGGLSDYLDPGFNCYKIAGYSQEYDVERIMKVVRSWSAKASDSQLSPLALAPEVLAEYRHENIIRRFKVILEDINVFFDNQNHLTPNIKSLTRQRIAQLLVRRILSKLSQKYLKLFLSK
ncbi:MAG TPA: glycosyltransferase [Cyanobacteria bacterium UBA11149]|nr:glycosyltransferase [Cyanobacteria bacterium UBA11367]HBE57675.1 glycosyltransferase [Cyanobacteria bacterium UBA11366]HBK65851.1 glycosyltransferase [Cyanobacteria bacterium UBA11166]HBR72863.1 glycosyltransferase [Cyanobacteria bacterium UBA11159]HBS67827.1 glycosyltransferase [Cyanobacteria bacterium UBA11153]HBW90232.1 glycosyltransferase [Cyanobacteria bacterium UBA11149]HCA93314.1 glycosyltransferase [Cyanobacteria bacterium UBA9226]